MNDRPLAVPEFGNAETAAASVLESPMKRAKSDSEKSSAI